MIAAFKLDDVKDRDEPFSENGQIQIDYVTEQILPMLTDEGAWIAPGPSPLDTDEVLQTYKVIVEHPNYRGQTLRCPDCSGWWIEYDAPNGIVTISEPKP
jgi:hypothetical protein